MTDNRRLRGAIRALWLALAGTSLALAAALHLAPLVGLRLIVIEGASMEPSIPLGSVAIVATPSPATLVAGDVVTIRFDSGVLVTHRVIRVVTLPSGIALETQGDANAAADPTLVPATSVVGIVVGSVPLVGFAIAFMTMPSGMVALFAALAALLSFGWLLDERETARRQGAARPRAVDGVGA